jgi:maltose alpha-D-glucosyltransferase/alpha-amylase
MGEDLSLPGREAIRTPMQWSTVPGAGSSSAAQLVRPVVAAGTHTWPTNHQPGPDAYQ